MESNVNKSFKEGMQDTPTVKLVEAGLERIHDLPQASWIKRPDRAQRGMRAKRALIPP
ncbi:MAG: hypothetical protein ACP5T2_02775 [Thermoprotei archaeon]